MWLIGSTFEIESCGCSQFQEEKTNSRGWGDGLSQAYLVGSFTGKEKEMNLETGRRWGCKKKKKKSPCMFWNILLWELSSRIQFTSSLPEIFPRAEESFGKTRLRNNCSHHIFAWENLLFLARWDYCVKCHIWPLLGNFLFSLIHVVFCIMLKAHKLYYSYVHQTKSTFK